MCFFKRKATIYSQTGDLFRADSNKMQFKHNWNVLEQIDQLRGNLEKKEKNSQHKTVVLWILLNGNCSQTVHKMRKPQNWQQWTTSRLHLFYFLTTSVFTFTEHKKKTLSREHTVRLWILLGKMCQHVLSHNDLN